MPTPLLRFALCSFLIAFAHASGQVHLSTDSFSVTVDSQGLVTSMRDLIRQHEYVAPNAASPLLTVSVNGHIELPTALRATAKPGIIAASFSSPGVHVIIAVSEEKTHLVFEVIETEADPPIDVVAWGPFCTTIDDTVAEVVGVVRDDQFAIGLQALNVKTLAGRPQGNNNLYTSRGTAAEARPWGSVLQAYSVDRSRQRQVTLEQFGCTDMPVPPIPGETVVGSRIALFGCRASDALQTIGLIEQSEGLPHPLIDGVWSKVSPATGRSYLIASFSEQTVDELLSYTLRAGLMTLYHDGPFESWGHYELKRDDFPHGVEGMKSCAARAKALGIRLGGHTLTNFIQTNDPYVTPVPDPRLAVVGNAALTGDIDSLALELPVASPGIFQSENNNWLHTVVIDKELIRYGSVSVQDPWRLLGCERGAFGTRRSAHRKGAAVAKLVDHAYKVFFPNIDLQREIARNLARRFNETGLSQMDFDGHEGCAASGQGDYAIDLFSKDFFDAADHTVINGTSMESHYYWHINTYCNWGEPWNGGFREAMQQYRLNNQEFFERNYLPHMLGWYLLTEKTSLADMEWMLARAAGYNAGFALATDLESLRKNPHTGLLLDAVREWEAARRSGAFSSDQRLRLRDTKQEFHLVRESAVEWKMFSAHITPDFEHKNILCEPGQPQSVRWEYLDPDTVQPLQFRLRVLGDHGSISNPAFEIEGAGVLTFPLEAAAGQSIVCDGTETACLCDSLGQTIRAVNAPMPMPRVGRGKHCIRFTCAFSDDPSLRVAVNFLTMGRPERVKRAEDRSQRSVNQESEDRRQKSEKQTQEARNQ